MKNAKKIFSGWFWIWAIVSIILVGAMLIVGHNKAAANGMAAAIMALLMVLPVRDWMYRFIVWAIDYVSSINTNFKDRINPHATYNRLVDPTKREENVGFYRSLKVVIGVITVILALLWLVFQGTSFNVVYAFLHTVEFILRGKIGWLALLVYILITIGYIYAVYRFVGLVLNGELYDSTGSIDWQHSWWMIALMVAIFYFKIIFSGVLLKFTAAMIFSEVIFWTVVVGFPILIFEIWNFIQRHRNP